MSGQVRLGIGAAVVIALVLSFYRPALALTPTPDPAPQQDCNPCVTVIDQPAWDETQTVTDQAAYDEAVTVIDVPASTGTRTIVDTPAHSVAHHDLVSPATTVARSVLVTAGYYQNVSTLVPGHYEYGQVWTPSGYWTSVWVSSGYWTQQWVSSGYWSWQWQSSGYWGQVWVYAGYYASQYVPSGYWSYQWVSTGGHWEFDCDDFCYRYWEPDGYYATVWIDTSYWTSVWVDTSHYEARWFDTSHWQLVYVDTSAWQSIYVDTSHYDQRWVDTSSWQPGAVWTADRYITAATYVPSGYMGWHCYWDDGARECDQGWISTAYTAYPNQQWVAPVYTTVYDPVPAVYNDWIEQVPALTHTETYTIPAVTHQTTVHHAAVTHTVTVHHDAVTHQEQAPSLVSQSNQGAPAGTSATLSGGSGSTASPVTIPVVSTITLIDTPATTLTVTVVDTPAYDTTRTVVDHVAWDETVTTPVWDVDCDERCVRYIDHWDTSVVHHDAATHQETVHVPAVTHQEAHTNPAVTHTETLRYDAIVGQFDPSSRGTAPSDDLLAFATLAGLMAVAGAGRFASRADELKAAAAQLARLGSPVPPEVAPLLTDDSPQTVTTVETVVVASLAASEDAPRADAPAGTASLDPGSVDTTSLDTPPSGADTAAARRSFDAWLADRAARNAPVVAPDAIWMPGPDEITDADRAHIQNGIKEFLANTMDVPEGAIGLAAQMLVEAYGGGEGKETAEVIERSKGKNPLEIMGEIGAVMREARQSAPPVLSDSLTVAEDTFAVASLVEGGVALARAGAGFLDAAAAGGRAASRAEVEAYVANLEASAVRAKGAARDFQITKCGPTEWQLAGPNATVSGDGINIDQALAQDGKYISKPGTSPYVDSSSIDDDIRAMIRQRQLTEFGKYADVVADPSNPLRGLEVITNRADAVSYFDGLMRDTGLSGQISVIDGGQESTVIAGATWRAPIDVAEELRDAAAGALIGADAAAHTSGNGGAEASPDLGFEWAAPEGNSEIAA